MRASHPNFTSDTSPLVDQLLRMRMQRDCIADLSAMKPRELMETALVRVAAALQADTAQILQFRQTQGDLVAVEGFPQLAALPQGLITLASTTFHSQTAACHDEYLWDEQHQESTAREGSVLMAPIIYSGESWGVAVVSSSACSAFCQDDVPFLQTTGQLFAACAARMEGSEHEHLQMSVFDNLSTQVAYVTRDLIHQMCNTSYTRWYDLPREAIIGHSLAEVLGEGVLNDSLSHIQMALSGERVVFECKKSYRFGGHRYIRTHYEPYWVKGEVEGFYALIDDVTEQRILHAELKQYNLSLQEMVARRTKGLSILTDNVPALFSYVGMDLRCKYANVMYERVFNFQNAECIGKHVAEIHDPRNYPLLRKWFSRALDGEPQQFEALLELDDDKRISIRANIVPHFNADGQQTGIFVLMSDVSEQKAIEKAILEAEQEEKSRIGRELHDSLCQEISGIALLSRALSKQLENENHPQATQATQISQLAHAAADQTRCIAHGLSPIAIGKLSLGQAIEKYLAAMRSLHPKIQFSFACDQPTYDLPTATASQLYLVCREGIANAVRHTSATSISIHVDSVENEDVILSITDNGGGDPQRIFENSGFGIASMRHRATLLGGYINWAKSPDGSGVVLICKMSLEPFT